MLKAPSLEKQAVIEALYLILGQDCKSGGWNHDRNKRFGKWSGRAYAAHDEWDWEEEPWPEDTGYYEDDWPVEDYEEEPAFDDDAGYYGEDPWMAEDSNETSPEHLAEEFDTAFASYTDARNRKRFNDLKVSRGFLPVVALTDQQQPMTAAPASSSSSSTTWRKGKGKGGKNKGKGSNTIRYPPGCWKVRFIKDVPKQR